MQQIVIGLNGLAQSGKSTLANHLRQRHGFETVAFAEPLKKMLLELGVPAESLYGHEKEKPLEHLCGKSGRFLMQTLGTEWGRAHVGKEVWSRAWRKRVSSLSLVVADDVRFDTEVAAVQQMGGLVIQIVRPNVVSIAGAKHASEVSVNGDHVDMTIVNDGPVSKMTNRMDQILEHAFGLVAEQAELFEAAE